MSKEKDKTDARPQCEAHGDTMVFNSDKMVCWRAGCNSEAAAPEHVKETHRQQSSMEDEVRKKGPEYRGDKK